MSSNRSGGLELWDSVIEQYPLLTRKEEAEMLARIRAGDEAALEEIPLYNLKAIIKVVESFHPKASDKHDLLMAGIEGFKKAARKFKPVHRAGHREPTRLFQYAFLYCRDSVRTAARKMWHSHVSFDAPCGTGDDGGADGYEAKDEVIGTVEFDQTIADLSLLEDLGRTGQIVITHRLLDDVLSDKALSRKIGIREAHLPLTVQRTLLRLLEGAREQEEAAPRQAGGQGLLTLMTKLGARAAF